MIFALLSFCLVKGSPFLFQQHLQEVEELEQKQPLKFPKRVWLEPFQDESIHESDELFVNRNEDEIPTVQDLLKARPKTACCLRDKNHENITKSKHEILINLLNVMETRRIRKTAYSHR